MFGQIIRALIYLCFLVLAFYLIVWVLQAIGLALPAMVIHIIGIIFVLVAILVLYQLFWPYFATYSLWGRRPPPNP